MSLSRDCHYNEIVGYHVIVRGQVRYYHVILPLYKLRLFLEINRIKNTEVLPK